MAGARAAAASVTMILRFCQNMPSGGTISPSSDLLEQPEPFSGHVVLKTAEPRHVPTRMREACNKASANRSGDPHKHNRRGLRLEAQGGQRERAVCEDDLFRQAYQFRRICSHLGQVCARVAVVDLEVPSDCPSEIAESLPERLEITFGSRVVAADAQQHADPPHSLGLLRPRRERPSSHAAEKRNELPPLHSITSSSRGHPDHSGSPALRRPSPSPVVLTIRPPWLATIGSIAARCSRRARAVPVSSAPISGL